LAGNARLECRSQAGRLGIGHLQLVITQQVLCTRRGGAGATERMLGNYMVANAIGQGVGPYIVAWFGGGARIPPTDALFLVCLATAVLTFTFSLLLRPGGLSLIAAGAIAQVRRVR